MAQKRKIIVWVAISADGFIARLDGAIDWLDRPRPKGNYGMVAFYKSIDTTLWGRKTCDMALEYQKKGVPGRPSIRELKTMSSRTLSRNRRPPAGVEFVTEPIKAFATRLRGKRENTFGSWVAPASLRRFSTQERSTSS